jgi:hypothetical protein
VNRREFFAATIGLAGAKSARIPEAEFREWVRQMFSAAPSPRVRTIFRPPRLHYRSEHADLIDRLLTYNLDLPEMHRQQRLHYLTTALEEMS